MWPRLLDMTKEESVQSLRNLELETYSSLVSVLRAQGSLSNDKRRILRETGILLNISHERHKAEIRRAINDERLNTIAYHITGRTSSLEDWSLEGRRLIPLLPRAPPQSTYLHVADEASETASQTNKQLPFPSNTERKRTVPQLTIVPPISTNSSETSGKSTFRIPEVPKEEQTKRKRHHSVSENSTLAQHLLGTKSLSKIQQIYRQASKSGKQKISETSTSSDTQGSFNQSQTNIQQPTAATSKINIIQNITIPSSKNSLLLNERTTFSAFSSNESQVPSYRQNSIAPETFLSSNEYQVSPMNHKPFIAKDIQNLSNLDHKTENSSSESRASLAHYPISLAHEQMNNVSEQQTVESHKLNKKVITIPTNSILQKTLSVPINKLTKLNLEKFKILPNSNIQLPSKPKLLTIKSGTAKKVIPLSQLQMLQNAKGSLKMVPYNLNNSNKIIKENNGVETVNVVQEINGVENGEITETVNKNIENDIRISAEENNSSNSTETELDSIETLSTESYEIDEVNNSEDMTDPEEINVNNCEFLKTYEDYHQETGEILEDFEIIHTEEFLQ